MKYYLIALALIAAPGAASAENVVIKFSGTFGSDAYGLYHPGDTFSGVVTYGRQREEYQYNPGPEGDYLQIRGSNDVPLEISFSTSLESYTAVNPYLTYFSKSNELQLANARTIPLFGASFYDVKIDRNYLPTFAQLMGHKGSFDYTSRTSDEEFSGGTGRLTFEGTIAQPVPEPATWASMFAGLALAGGVANYRRRKTKVAYA